MPGKRIFGRTIDRYDVPDTPQLEKVQREHLRHSIEHLHGPEEIVYDKDETVVLCLLRNGRHYLKSFLEHYFSLGAKHIVFLDNGSTDGTVEFLKQYDRVTVLRSGLSFKTYQLLMRKYLVERFGRNRWTLLVDIDELFDYPYSEVVDLRSLLEYLNEQRYTAVVSYMLDMFPEEPLSEFRNSDEVFVKKLHRFYDTSNITAFDYHAAEETGNVLANEEIKILQGGVQRRLFNLHPMLIKHPLIFLEDGVRPADMSEHWVGGARVADFAGVLFHYKLSGSLAGLVRREVEERRYVNRHGKYEKYHKVLKETPSLLIKNGASRELESVNDLVGNGFLPVSALYMEFVQERAPGRLVEAFFRARREIELQRREPGTRVQQLQGELVEERRRADFLQKQLEGVLGSRSWRTLNLMNRLRKKFLQRTRRS
jgi:glycosyltransferase involved in cell wall biosynthesis